MPLETAIVWRGSNSCARDIFKAFTYSPRPCHVTINNTNGPLNFVYPFFKPRHCILCGFVGSGI